MSLLPPEVETRFEEGAALARAEFEAKWKIENWTAVDVAKWWFKWCRGIVASNGVDADGVYVHGTNHDRLGRILMEVTGVKFVPKPSPDVSDEEARRLGVVDETNSN